ncbi:ATP-binding protein [Paenibacillus sp. 1P07SE]|uniref:hybrid sensor histidine kinase/response regulator n=1 Tax=Paenibacillus sp. 1P07SE TaxID=3132209 RepID=UPI0039A4AADF
MMSNKRNTIRNLLLLLLFVLILGSLRLIWYTNNKLPEQPFAQQGVLELREWDIGGQSSINLDGEWEFYPGQLLTSEQLAGPEAPSPRYLTVPGTWQAGFGELKENAFGSGTYRLIIQVNRDFDEPYGLWIQGIQASSQLEINGTPEGMFGQVASSEEEYRPRNVTYTATVVQPGPVIELIVRVANYEQPNKGGIVKPIRFGSQATIDSERMYSIGFQLIAFVVMLLHGLYAGILYMFNRGNPVFLLFLALMVTVGLSIVSDHDNLLMLWLPFNYTWAFKIRLLSYVGLSFFMLLLTFSFSGQKRGWLFSCYITLFLLFSGFVIVSDATSIYYVYDKFRPMLFLYLLPIVWVIALIVKMLMRNKDDAIYLLLGGLGIVSSAGWGVFVNLEKVRGTYYPVDIIAALVGFSAYWFKRYFRNWEENLRLNEQLKLADKQKDEFLANTSHELRTPLHGIMNIAQTVADKEKHAMGEQSRKDMELLVTLSRRMSHMVGDLLDAVRLQDRAIVLEREPVLLQSACAGVMDMLSFMKDDKHIQFQMLVPPNFPPVDADEKRLVQVLFNLLHNAVKYTEKGVIAVSAEVKGRYAVLHIEDTGRGMDEDLQSRIFDRYEQGSLGQASGGIGLGLHIAKQLVELHDGHMSVRSTPGEGTVFSVTLPLSSGKAAPRTAVVDDDLVSAELTSAELTSALVKAMDLERATGTRDLPKSAGPLRILAVDDDPVNLKVIVGLLATDQCLVQTSRSAQEAVERLSSESWDLLIADVMMPEMSGYELTRLARERFKLFELPILLLTARSQPEDISAGFRAGANDYVTKPVDAMELRYRVLSLTALKQSVNETMRMEAAYLQAQIQPHFLFNTLNSIMALSDIDLRKMQQLVDAFASYLRISFNFLNTKELVPLSHELQLVQAYLYIEQERFGERLAVVMETGDSMGIVLPPLTLQPLVENAVRHGLMQRSRGGTLRILVERRPEGSVLTVSDDGKGMTEEQVVRLLGSDQPPERGIGLYNTDRRLKQRYGKGLMISSRPGEGTTISFLIPAPMGGETAGAV